MSTERNELESLFIECIEEVRKEIMKRRLKNEIYNRKKFQQLDKSSEEAKEFEESLLRLAQLAKNRVKVSDFTTRDKSHILDLFVNNERTLLKIYEALFPHRAAPSTQSQMQPISMNMMENSFNNSMQMMGGRSDQRSQGGTRGNGQNFAQASFQNSLNQSYNGPVQAMMAQMHQQ